VDTGQAAFGGVPAERGGAHAIETRQLKELWGSVMYEVRELKQVRLQMNIEVEGALRTERYVCASEPVGQRLDSATPGTDRLDSPRREGTSGIDAEIERLSVAP